MPDHEDRFDNSHISPAARDALKSQPKEIADQVRRVADGGGDARENGTGSAGRRYAPMTCDASSEHVAGLHRALGLPPPEPAEPPKVVDLKTRGPYHPPGSIGRTLSDIADAFRPVPSDG